MASNLKDTLSTIAGLVFAVASAILAATASGLVLPAWLTTACGVAVAISGALIGFLTGKAPSGKAKTEEQVVASNVPDPVDAKP